MPTGYLVFNPHAGRFPSRMLTERAAEVLTKHDWNVQLEQTTGGPEITRLAQRAAVNKIDAFFVAGGDGSVNLAVAGLVGSETALGVPESRTCTRQWFGAWSDGPTLPWEGWWRTRTVRRLPARS